ncbi:MAG: SdpI family protein [Lachnospiraceae bacterium]
MLKRNKTWLMITSLIILIPIAFGIYFWNELPETMATHFDSANEPNGYSSKFFAVFGLPLFLLAVHLLCAVVTANDPRRQNVSDKIYRMILLICPASSLLCGGAIYTYALTDGVNFGIDMIMVINLFMAVIFLVVGNYLPKTRQNYTIGIKLPWTFYDVENWNRTHRMAGWVWMAVGVIFVFNAFVKSQVLMLAGICIAVFVPTLYSFLLYWREKK